MTSHFSIIVFCLLWVLMCGRVWWAVGPRHVWQRRLIAIGAGLGAGMFYLLGTTIWNSVKREPPPVLKTGEEIRVSPRVVPNQ